MDAGLPMAMACAVLAVAGSAKKGMKADPKADEKKDGESVPPIPIGGKKEKTKEDILYRVHDEKMGVYVCGKYVKIVQQISEGVYMMRIQSKCKDTVGGNIMLTDAQIENTDVLKDVTQWKPLKLKKEDHVALDSMFDVTEINSQGSFDDDVRLYSMHIDMGWWMIKRDFLDWKEMEDVVYLDPEFLSASLAGMRSPDPESDASTEMLRAIARIRSKIDHFPELSQLIICPIFGGTGDGDFHWTVLFVEKIKDGDIKVEYKDSLGDESASCRQNAKEILILVLMAMEHGGEVAMPPRCNIAKQPIGDPLCGHFVLHWIRQKMHQFFGEGSAAGYPDPLFWRRKIETLRNSIVKNAGVGKILEAVREAHQKKIKAEADKLKAIAETIENDAQMQEAKAEMAQRWLEESFAHIGSCPQCNLRFGSTCCNPDKISAKQQAEKDKASEMGWDAPIQGDYDKKRYREIYSKILMDRAHAMTSDEKPLTSKDKGGGPKIDANGSVQKRNQVQ